MLSISFIENLLEILFIMEHECTLNLEITHEIFKPPSYCTRLRLCFFSASFDVGGELNAVTCLVLKRIEFYAVRFIKKLNLKCKFCIIVFTYIFK